MARGNAPGFLPPRQRTRTVVEDGAVGFIGYQGLKRAMAKVEPDLKKQMEKELVGHLRPIVNQTRSALKQRDGLSGLKRSGLRRIRGDVIRYPGKGAPNARMYTARANTKTGVLVARRLVQTGQFGAAIGLAGSKSDGVGIHGQTLIAAIDRLYRPTRSIYESYDQAGGDKVVLQQVQDTLSKWDKEFQRVLNNAGSE